MQKPWSFYFFSRKPVVLPDRYTLWRRLAAELSPPARARVEWFIFYYSVAQENTTATCGHFGVSRKTFYKWRERFKQSQWDVRILEDQSRAPHTRRTWEVTPTQEVRIRELRQRHLHYGKKKLQVLYQRRYGGPISTWKIERVIRKHRLYPDQQQAQKTARKRARARQHPKQRISASGGLAKERRLWFLLQLDTKVLYEEHHKRYIFVGVDHASKLGYARMYATKSSHAAADFLYRLQYLIAQPIVRLRRNNGSEFARHFQAAATRLGMARYFSRVKTPKDNSEAERFIHTLLYEWLYDANFSLDCEDLNPRLTGWLVEYNFHRPHQSLDYRTPMQYIEQQLTPSRDSKVSPMCPASTIS
jgi:transposase